ncbi:hypothetical protein AAFF_G00005490 [Aldrovandia affinis]|uniref:Uncharacterized protein n=1 Tax=Aldrovandia affinis TaxID=143900 RepID=A0AAD7TDU2_9TELE|nr:hypothetical protein AAFF_G00005490 [Aldrovandia affinis]
MRNQGCWLTDVPFNQWESGVEQELNSKHGNTGKPSTTTAFGHGFFLSPHPSFYPLLCSSSCCVNQKVRPRDLECGKCGCCPERCQIPVVPGRDTEHWQDSSPISEPCLPLTPRTPSTSVRSAGAHKDMTRRSGG